jgi:hypothetical protein
MLTDPRINAGVVTPSGGLILSCRGEKLKQYYTSIYSAQYSLVGFSECKISLPWP